MNANNFALNNNNHYVRTGCATDPVSLEELSLIAFIIFGTETLKKHGLSENTITILYIDSLILLTEFEEKVQIV